MCGKMEQMGGNNECPAITTIIPTFQRPQLLRRAILSALDQVGVRLKVCVYDNASHDETADVVAELASRDSRLVYYRHSSNIGGVANFEFGMSRVETPFFSFLSDDDYLLPCFYRRALDGLREHREAMCWAGMTLNVDEQGTIWDARVLNWPREGLFEPPEGFMQMLGGLAPTWTGIVFRRESIDRVGKLDPLMLGPSDLEYCLRLASRFPFILEKHPSAVFTLHGSSFSATQPMTSFWPGWKRMLSKFEADGNLSSDFKREALRALQKDAVRMLFRRGANAIAEERMDFVSDAADALEMDCDQFGRASILRLVASGCMRSSAIQHAYTSTYRWAERRVVRSRVMLQEEFGRLLRTG